MNDSVTNFARALLLVVFLGLAACGAKEDIIEPSPLPSVTAEVNVVSGWSARMGSGASVTGSRLEPAITAQAVYAADDAGQLVARSRVDGKLLWKKKTSFSFSAGPVAGYGQLFLGTREGDLVAFSADQGEQLWKFQLGGEVLSPPAVDSDSVVVKATDGHVTLLERTTGSLRWVYDGGVPVLAVRAASRPQLLPDAVIVGLPSGMLVAIDRAKGQVIWERRVAEPDGKSELDRLVDLAGDFLLAGERLYAASYQGKVVAMDLRSGQFLWQLPFSTHQPLAAAGDAVFGVDADSRVVAWRAADGVVLWRQELLLGRGVTGAVIHGTHLLLGDAAGYLHIIRQADGVIVGRKRIDSDGISAPPVVDEGGVYVLGRSGKFAALTIEQKQ